MASSSALIIPLTLLLIGTRTWALGKKHGFMTPVQMFRDRWECSHIGTAIFALQALFLVPYIIIAVKGGGTVLQSISGGWVPYWLGGSLVALVVMSYVFFGGMRGTAWVNTFQTTLFLSFGAAALLVIGGGMGGFSAAMERIAQSPTLAPLLTRENVSPLYFLSYTFIPLSAICFPHIGIFCLTARRMAQFRKTVILYPICIMAIWLPCVFLGVAANGAEDFPRIQQKQAARQTLATSPTELTPERESELRRQMAADDVIPLLLDRYAPLWLAGLLGAGILAAVMASDSQILALSTMFTEDIFAFYGGKARFGDRAQVQTGPGVRGADHIGSLCDCPEDSGHHIPGGHTVLLYRLRRSLSPVGGRSLLEAQHPLGSPGRHPVGRWLGRRHCPAAGAGVPAVRPADCDLVLGTA